MGYLPDGEEILRRTPTLSEELYLRMALIRAFEEAIIELFSEGKLLGTTHLYIGQEADAVGILSHATSDDLVFSNHRSHGHYLALTGDVDGLAAELMGRATGISGGRGGSQHLHRPNFTSNGILGGTIPSATGVALAKKLRGESGCVVAFLGDGTLGEGVVYESLNMASLWKLPIIYVLEDNGYAQTTPKHMAIAGDITLRGKAFGLTTYETHSTDVEMIYEQAGPLLEKARSSEPVFWTITTYRLSPHSKGDDIRPLSEIEERRKFEPLVLQRKLISADAATQIDSWCHSKVVKAINFAQEAPMPDLSSDTYATSARRTSWKHRGSSKH